MAGSFTCPHCGARYPIQPVLIGRAVRCRSCKQAFCLRADGVAEAVPAPAASAPAAKTPPSSDEPDPTPPASSKSSDRIATKRPGPDREALRRSLSSSLSQAAAEALNASSVRKQETDRHKRPKTSPFGAQRDGTKEIGPAVLTGQGEDEARSLHHWLIGLAVGGVLVVVIMLALTGENAQTKALRSYNAAAAGERTVEARIHGLRSRMWLYDTDQPAIANMQNATIQAVQRHDLRPIGQVLNDSIRNHAYLADLGLWLHEDHRLRAEGMSGAPSQRRQLIDDAGIPTLTRERLLSQLRAAGDNDVVISIIDRLLHGRTDPDGGNFFREMFSSGNIPEFLEIAPFKGRDGLLLMPHGSMHINYQGRLMRLPGWRGRRHNKSLADWHVLDVTVAS